MDFPSKLIEEAVNQVSKLPGIGKKTALRLVLHLIKEKKETTFALTEALATLRENIRFCKKCHNISDAEVCSICTSHRRDPALLCVVEDTKDVMAKFPHKINRRKIRIDRHIYSINRVRAQFWKKFPINMQRLP